MPEEGLEPPTRGFASSRSGPPSRALRGECGGLRTRDMLLDDLKDRGPFAPIFRAVGEPDRAVNWIGEGRDG